jgi:ABC-type glycerol-3-phosphate transport system substrate-binding protein
MKRHKIVLAAVAGLVLTGCGPGNTSMPMTPGKLGQAILDKNAAENTANPLTNVQCDPQQPTHGDGSGRYQCDLTFQAGVGSEDIVVAPDGTWTRTTAPAQ